MATSLTPKRNTARLRANVRRFSQILLNTNSMNSLFVTYLPCISTRLTALLASVLAAFPTTLFAAVKPAVKPSRISRRAARSAKDVKLLFLGKLIDTLHNYAPFSFYVCNNQTAQS